MVATKTLTPRGIASTGLMQSDFASTQSATSRTIVVRSFFRSPILTTVDTAASFGVKEITQANVFSTTTVSDTSVKIGNVRPGTINSTGTFTGGLRGTKIVNPSPINSTATFGAPVVRSPQAQIGLAYLWGSGNSAGGVVAITTDQTAEGVAETVTVGLIAFGVTHP
jgi:hypothetical protein